MSLTNFGVVSRALEGGEGHNGRHSMSTGRGMRSFGWLPEKLCQTLRELRAKTPYRVEHTVYSYATPIAFRVAGEWIIPDGKYSTTTSTKHQAQLGRIYAKYIPTDLSLEELVRVIEGKMTYYCPGTLMGGKDGRWSPGPNYVEGE